MATDFINSKKIPAKSTTVDKLDTLWLSAIPMIMTPKSRSFDQVLDSSSEHDTANRSNSDGDRNSGRSGEESEASKETDNIHKEKVRGVLEKSWSSNSAKLHEKNLQIAEHHKHFIKHSEDKGSQLNQKGNQKQLQQISLNALHAERTMEEIEKAAEPKAKNQLPPELMDELVAQITSYQLEDKKRGLRAQIHNNALGGKLSVRIHETGQGGFLIGFEGDSHVLEFLQANQDELKDVLRNKGYDFSVLFG